MVINATFKIKHSKLKGIQEKESNMSVRCGWKIPSLGITVLHHSTKPRDAKQWPLGQNFLSAPLTHVRFLYYALALLPEAGPEAGPEEMGLTPRQVTNKTLSAGGEGGWKKGCGVEGEKRGREKGYKREGGEGERKQGREKGEKGKGERDPSVPPHPSLK